MIARTRVFASVLVLASSVIASGLASGMASPAWAAGGPNKAECQKHRQEQVDRYNSLASDYNKRCVKLQGEEVFAPVREIKNGFFCGYLGLKKAPKSAAEKDGYFKVAKEYSAACRALLREKALARVTMSGVDCGYSGISGDWASCPDLK